jgi:hypothetical protein
LLFILFRAINTIYVVISSSSLNATVDYSKTVPSSIDVLYSC